VHEVSGAPAYVSDLAPVIDAHWPVYGLSAQGLMDGEAPLRSIVEMARTYIEAIRTVQPKGPYYLAGWSAGGTIAYEIAQQFEAGGEIVAFLGLLDTFPGYETLDGLRDKWAIRADDIGQQIDVAMLFLRLQQEGVFDDAQLRVWGALGGLRQVVAHIAPLLRQHFGLEMEDCQRYCLVAGGIGEGLINYVPGKLNVTPDLFAAMESMKLDGHRRWQQLHGDRLRIHTVEGDHFSMKREHLAQLGTAFSAALQRSLNGRHLPETKERM
jgi:thioesterase domain-containing protein